MDTHDIWIEKGYEHFGIHGPNELSIKLIAEESSIARTTFNYHFLNKEEFCNELLDKHYELLNQYCDLGELHCRKYLPDIHELALAFPSGFKFHKQLFNHRNIPKYNRVYKKCNTIAGKRFSVQLFIDYYNLPLSFEAATQLHDALVDAWYSRLDTDHLTLEKMVHSTEVIMKGVLKLVANVRKGIAQPPIKIPSFI